MRSNCLRSLKLLKSLENTSDIIIRLTSDITIRLASACGSFLVIIYLTAFLAEIFIVILYLTEF